MNIYRPIDLVVARVAAARWCLFGRGDHPRAGLRRARQVPIDDVLDAMRGVGVVGLYAADWTVTRGDRLTIDAARLREMDILDPAAPIPQRDLWMLDGRAQVDRITTVFGWNVTAYGYPSEDSRYEDPRATGSRTADVGLVNGAGRAMLRYILSLEPAETAPHGDAVPAASAGTKVWWYFDVAAMRHVRCVETHPWCQHYVDGDPRDAALAFYV